MKNPRAKLITQGEQQNPNRQGGKEGDILSTTLFIIVLSNIVFM